MDCDAVAWFDAVQIWIGIWIGKSTKFNAFDLDAESERGSEITVTISEVIWESWVF